MVEQFLKGLFWNVVVLDWNVVVLDVIMQNVLVLFITILNNDDAGDDDGDRYNIEDTEIYKISFLQTLAQVRVSGMEL
jgi:hypothetical protein